MQGIFVFCEGPHDKAFLYKILRSMGYKDYSKKKMKDMIYPINEYLISSIKDREYDNLNIENVSPNLPLLVANESTVFLLFSVGGDSQVEYIKETIGTFKDISCEMDFSMGKGKIDKYTFIMFYDADLKGRHERVKEIKNNFIDIFPEIEGIEHNTKLDLSWCDVGCYIFYDKHNKEEQGKLEDILLPIMKRGNEEIFTAAEKFITSYGEKDDNSGFKKQKAIIGAAGQLRKSGASNVSIIRQAGYITNDDISNNDNCIEIINFFCSLTNEYSSKEQAAAVLEPENI